MRGSWKLIPGYTFFFSFLSFFRSFLSGGTTSSLGSRFAADNPIDFVARTSRLASNLLFSLSICFSLLSSDAALILLLLTFRIWSITKWKRFSQLPPFSPFRLHLSALIRHHENAPAKRSPGLFFFCVTWLGKGTAAAETDSTKCERRWRAVLSLDSPNMPIELGKRKWRCRFYYDEFCLSLSLFYVVYPRCCCPALFSS